MVIFVNGTFDIVHTGHIKLLNYAKSLGDILYVAIDSDDGVRELKGSSRPINNQLERKLMLENLKPVDNVCIFGSSDELVSIIRKLNVDIMVKGSDYIGKPIVGSEYCKKIVFYEILNGYSTTKKIQSIINR